MTTTGTVDVDAVRRVVEAVPDPELPPVTIGMLGMVHHLDVRDGEVVVELLPTYSGCPATQMIERDVADAVRGLDGVDTVTVRFRFDPPWSPDRIDAVGRERLRGFGIAPPGGVLHDAVRPEGRRVLPVAAAGGAIDDVDVAPRPCPFCGSDATERDSAFGPTPCRDVRFCRSCRQPFEAFRSA